MQVFQRRFRNGCASACAPAILVARLRALLAQNRTFSLATDTEGVGSQPSSQKVTDQPAPSVEAHAYRLQRGSFDRKRV